jgi:hypothetical protein
LPIQEGWPSRRWLDARRPAVEQTNMRDTAPS